MSFPRLFLFEVVENAVFAAADEVASLGDQEDAGGAEVLIFVRTPESR